MHHTLQYIHDERRALQYITAFVQLYMHTWSGGEFKSTAKKTREEICCSIFEPSTVMVTQVGHSLLAIILAILYVHAYHRHLISKGIHSHIQTSPPLRAHAIPRTSRASVQQIQWISMCITTRVLGVILHLQEVELTRRVAIETE